MTLLAVKAGKTGFGNPASANASITQVLQFLSR